MQYRIIIEINHPQLRKFTANTNINTIAWNMLQRGYIMNEEEKLQSRAELYNRENIGSSSAFFFFSFH